MRDTTRAVVGMLDTTRAVVGMRDTTRAVVGMRDTTRAVVGMRDTTRAVVGMRDTTRAVVGMTVAKMNSSTLKVISPKIFRMERDSYCVGERMATIVHRRADALPT
jgi:hypothetical protein